MSTELEKHTCLKPTWHGPHDWWYTSSGGGHMLAGEPDETDWRVEKGLIQYTCPGNPEPEIMSTPPAEPESEQMFQAYERGAQVGYKQAIQDVYEALVDAADGDGIQAISTLLDEVGITR